MVQYVLISSIELSHIYSQQEDRIIQNVLRKYYLTVAVAFVIILISFRGMLLTGMFFHTGLENITALLINFFLAFLPIYVLTYFRFFTSTSCSFPSTVSFSFFFHFHECFTTPWCAPITLLSISIITACFAVTYDMCDKNKMVGTTVNNGSMPDR